MTYVVVKRNIGGSDKYFVEVFDDDFTTDSAAQIVSGFSGTTYSGYSHLNGKTVDVIRDDIVDPQVAVAGGNITVGMYQQVILRPVYHSQLMSQQILLKPGYLPERSKDRRKEF